MWVLFSVCFWVIEVVGLSVFRKCLAPSSGNSTATSRCLRGVEPPFAQTSRLRSLSLFVLSFAGLPVLPQRFVPLTTSSLRGSRSLFGLAAFLPCSLVTAPRVAFVVASSCPPPARHSVATAWLGGVRAHASCLSAEVNRPPTHASALGSFFGVLSIVSVLANPHANLKRLASFVGPVQRGAPAVAGCLPSLSLRLPLRSTPQPPSSCSAKPPHHDSGPRQHRPIQRVHREPRKEIGVQVLALPPVGLGLKWNLFVVRPLFHLTPSPPQRS